MRNKPRFRVIAVFVFLFALLFLIYGCDVEPEVIADPVDEEPFDLEEVENDDPIDEVPSKERPETPVTYYWPWLSHGLLSLSSGEVITGPDLFESELGFIVEFTERYSYDGLLVWLVEESDVFALEWVTLTFDVEYFEDSDWAHAINYEFMIEDFKPEPAEEGIQEFAVELVEEEFGFEVAIKRIVLGKGQEGSLSSTPINYVALEIEMNVIGN